MIVLEAGQDSLAQSEEGGKELLDKASSMHFYEKSLLEGYTYLLLRELDFGKDGLQQICGTQDLSCIADLALLL